MKETLFSLLQRQFGIQNINETDKLKNLGADSLDLVELLLEIEARLDVDLDARRFSEDKTIGEFLEEIQRQTKPEEDTNWPDGVER